MSPKMSRLKKLGEGSFGCVVSRPLECSGREKKISNKKHEERRQVGKLFYEQDMYKKELVLGRKSKQIDPSEEKMLVPISGCPVLKSVLKRPENLNAITKCENITSISNTNATRAQPANNVPNRVWQLKMPYGGVEIDMALDKYKNKLGVKQFARMMLPVFEGLLLLKQHRMVHQDIKVANVLAYKRKAILIDFSLMAGFDKIYTASNYNKLKRKYRPYPPEYYIASLAIKYASDINKLSKENIKGFLEDKFKNHLENIQHYFYPYYSISELISQSGFSALVSEAITDYKKMEKYADRVDVFSVGTVMCELSFYIKNPLRHEEFMMLMKGILHPDPRVRMSPEDALGLCKKIAGV